MLSTKTKYRSPEASAFYTAGLILLGIVVTAFLVSLFWTPYSPDATDAAAKLIARLSLALLQVSPQVISAAT